MALAAAMTALAGAASASATATFGCSASAARITVLGTNTIEPTTANVGAPACQTASATLSDALNGLNPAAVLLKPVSAQAVAAATTFSDGGGDPTKQAVQSVGGVADFKVNALPSIPGVSIDQITAPLKTTANTLINAIPVDFSSLGLVDKTAISTLLGGATSFNVDATSVVQSLVPAARALTTTQLLDLKAATAYATAACQNGQPVVNGASSLAGLTIAGQTLPTDQAVTQGVQLLPPLSVDFSKATVTNVSQLSLPGALAPLSSALHAVLDPLILSQVNSTLAALPTVSVPALGASVSFVPGQTVRSGDSVTQQAATISASVAGVKLVDAVIGEAKASESGMNCSPAASPSTPTGATLQCTTRKLVLVDVLQNGNRVKLNGVADPKYVGKTVSIVFGATGQTVAHAVVGKDGSFQTTAPLPAQKVRDTNRARYTAKIGRERSLDLKLRRRMIVRFMHSHAGKVTIVGRVVPPLGTPAKPITVTQRVSCGHDKVVGRYMPDRHGNFRITVTQPTQGTTAVYRLSTYVRPSAHSHRLSPTFTLPRAVQLHQG